MIQVVGDQAFFRPRSGLTVRTVEGEAVVLDKETGSVHHLNPTATYIWSQLDGRTSAEEVANRVTQTFLVEAGLAVNDVQKLVEQFQALRLLELVPDGVGEIGK